MIYYLGYYDVMKNGTFNRSISPAAIRKMNYIISLLKSVGDLTIISPAVMLPGVAGGLTDESVSKDSAKIVFAPSKRIKSRFGKFLRKIRIKIWLNSFIKKNITKRDVLLVYHSVSYAKIVYRAAKKIQCRLILEIEEIYSKVWNISKRDEKWETKLISRYGNGGLIVSEALKNELNFDKSIVSYGSYHIYEGFINPKGRKEKITLLFSGGIEETRGGAFNALDLIEIMPNNYELVITGFCDESCKEKFYKRILDINQKKGYVCANYLGLLSEKEFERILLNADLGLNLQKDGDYDGFLFPSKIITYLSYGLPVITTPGKSIVESCLFKTLIVSSDYSMTSIRDAIASIRYDSLPDTRATLGETRSKFESEFFKLLGA